MVLEISFSGNEKYNLPSSAASMYFDTVKSVAAFKTDSQQIFDFSELSLKLEKIIASKALIIFLSIYGM